MQCIGSAEQQVCAGVVPCDLSLSSDDMHWAESCNLYSWNVCLPLFPLYLALIFHISVVYLKLRLLLALAIDPKFITFMSFTKCPHFKNRQFAKFGRFTPVTKSIPLFVLQC